LSLKIFCWVYYLSSSLLSRIFF